MREKSKKKRATGPYIAPPVQRAGVEISRRLGWIGIDEQEAKPHLVEAAQ